MLILVPTGGLEVARTLIAGGAEKEAVDKFGRTCAAMLPDGSALAELFESN